MTLHDLDDSTRSPGTLEPGLDDLLAAVGAYERALMANDVAVLDDLFEPGPETMRSDGGATLVGHVQIAAFRGSRPPVPPRVLQRVHVRWVTPDVACVVAESGRAGGGTGAQTQLWRRVDGVWRVAVAHVSLAHVSLAHVSLAHVSLAHVSLAPAAPAPGLRDPHPSEDAATWRLPPGPDPLAAGSGAGALLGVRVAVKDLFAVGGHQVGAGNPTWLAEAGVEQADATAVALLRAAGADVVGVAQTDELAFSLAGSNAHFGTPPNPAAPGRVPGGSTSGPAAAVAGGQADLGLGTDTAGSIRVPASFCGLIGLRTTHGAVDRTGVLALAPSFDTVGLLATDATVLVKAARVLLARHEPVPTARLVVVPELFALAEPDTAEAARAATYAVAVRHGLDVGRETLDPDDLESWFTAFRTVQSAEAWAQHGRFVREHPGALEAAIHARFLAGSVATDDDLGEARSVLAAARRRLRSLVTGGTVLALPTTSAPAPLTSASAPDVEAGRAGTLRLTCLASLAGLPALSVPTGRVGPLPVGLCLLGAPGADLDLLDLLPPVPA